LTARGTWDRHDPAFPRHWGEVAIVVDDAMVDAAVAQLATLQRSPEVRMRNIAGRTNEPRTQLIGRLGELAVGRYYRWLGARAIVFSAAYAAGEHWRPYDHERDRFDLVIVGQRIERRIEVKTVHRTVAARPDYLAHLNRRTAELRPDDIYAFCSYYLRADGEEVVQYLGWQTGEGILREGHFTKAGECAPGDDRFLQKADNYTLPYSNLQHPSWLVM
jgi:hypothetical protein